MKTKRLLVSLTLGLGMPLAFLWLLTTGPLTLVHADTYTVTNTDASGPGSLRQAILDANGNPGHDTIDFGVTGTIVLTDALPPIGDDLTITGPGAEQLAVSGANAYRVFSITSGIGVTITGVTVRDGYAADSNGGGIWSAGMLLLDSLRITDNTATGSFPFGRGGGVYVYDGSATLSGTQVISNSATYGGGGVFVGLDSATLSVSGGRIDGNSATDGGGVYVDQGSAEISGTQVVSNSASYGGGGLIVWEGSATLSGTQVVGNWGPNGGGVVVVESSATLNVNGGGINSNTDSGVVVVFGNVMLSGTQIAGNSAQWGGGGVLVTGGSAMLNGGQVVSNSTSEYGGGVYVYRGSVAMSGTQVVSNSAGYGGGVYVEQGSATLTRTQVVSNYATGSWPSGMGGGVYVESDSAMLDASGGMIVSNSASSGGGGVYVESGSATLNGTYVVSNSAQSGGGVYVLFGNATLDVNGGGINNNLVLSFGGGVHVNQGNVTLSGTQVVSNSASYGGGVYVLFGNVTLNGTWVDSNSANHGGGMYVNSGSVMLRETQVVSNSAQWYGGGMLVGSGSVMLSGTRVVNNSASYGGGVYVESGSAVLSGTQIAANDALDGSALYIGGTITPMTALTVTGDIYQASGRFAGPNHDLRIEGSLVLAGGDFHAPDAPNELTLTGPYTHTGGTYHQTQIVNGSGDVGFPKVGGLIVNANGQDLGSTKVADTASANCTGVAAGAAVTHCYMVTPTIAIGRDAKITFYYNHSEIPGGQSCAAMEAFRWDGTWNNLLTRDGSYGTSGRMCGGDPLSIKVTGVMTFSPFVLSNLVPEITALPSSLFLGDQDVDAGATVSQTVTITNDGAADLHISVIISTGDTGEFNLVDSGEITLTSGSTRTIEVSFDPSSLGTKAVTLTIQSDDSDEPAVNVTLTGTGTDQEITVAPGSLDFGDQEVDAGATVSQTVTITNDGTADLHISSVGLTGTNADEFAVEGDTGESILTPGDTRAVQVAFDPATTGAKSASLTIQSDDSDEATIDVALSGVGIAADLTIAKSVTPTVAVLGDTVTYTIVISNAGDATATDVLMTDPLPSAVSFGSQSSGTALIPLPDHVYRWGPYDVAAFAAYTITFTANVTDNADFAGQTITNTAYVTTANIATDSDAVFVVMGLAQAGYGSNPAPGNLVNVGTANVGSTVSTTLTISETGEATLMVTPTLSGPDAADFGFAPITLTILDGGAAQDLTISCTPSFTGTLARTLAATLTVVHNAPGSPAVYSLSCTGEAMVYVYLPAVLKGR